MNNSSSSNTSGGIGFFGLLTILFVGLKLTNYIDWSWWWVLSPIWLPFTVVAFLLLITWLIIKFIDYVDNKDKKGD